MKSKLKKSFEQDLDFDKSIEENINRIIIQTLKNGSTISMVRNLLLDDVDSYNKLESMPMQVVDELDSYIMHVKSKAGLIINDVLVLKY